MKPPLTQGQGGAFQSMQGHCRPEEGVLRRNERGGTAQARRATDASDGKPPPQDIKKEHYDYVVRDDSRPEGHGKTKQGPGGKGAPGRNAEDTEKAGEDDSGDNEDNRSEDGGGAKGGAGNDNGASNDSGCDGATEMTTTPDEDATPTNLALGSATTDGPQRATVDPPAQPARGADAANRCRGQTETTTPDEDATPTNLALGSATTDGPQRATVDPPAQPARDTDAPPGARVTDGEEISMLDDNSRTPGEVAVTHTGGNLDANLHWLLPPNPGRGGPSGRCPQVADPWTTPTTTPGPGMGQPEW